MLQRIIIGGKMTTLTDGHVAELRAAVRGQVIARGDLEYDTARRVFNAMIDRRPVLIVRCVGAADVIASVRFARERGLVVSVRSGGHGVAGLAVCDHGLVIDLSRMKTMRIDPRRRVARCDPGLTLAEFDRETEAFGLATTMGTISMTGVTGLTLGGGLGWLMGKHGLACDNLISVDVVTAEGKLLVASEEENADLFWALRGGGGNFGVVTSLEFRLHEQGPVFAGLVAHAMTDCTAALRFLRDFARSAPDELALMGAVLTLPDGLTITGLAGCYSGDLKEAERVLMPLRSFGKPLVDQFQVMPYTAFQKVIDWWAEPGKQHYWRSGFLKELPDDTLGVLAKYGANKPSKRCGFGVEFPGGKASRIAPNATAFAHRTAKYNFLLLGSWDDPAENATGMQWVNEFWKEMKPSVGEGVYVNYLGVDEPAERVKAAFGANYARLQTVKAKYDPGNFFRANLTP
jgi:FAD/FMN-containing dehydrogenase